MKHCQSCGMPLSAELKRNETYCQYCSDESGNLYPKEVVLKGIVEWLKSFSPDQNVDFETRASFFLKSMPAWADK